MGGPLGIGLNIWSSTGSSGGGGGVVFPQTLTWPIDARYVFEGTAAGVKVGTVRDKASGTTLSILSVKDSTGAAAASTLFAVSGGDIVTGSTATAYATSRSYELLVRETLGAATNDTTLYIIVDPLPTPEIFTDDFNAADGPLRGRTGWTTHATENDVTNQDVIKITSNGVAYSNAVGGNPYSLIHTMSAPIAKIRAVLGEPGTGVTATTDNAPQIFTYYSSTNGSISIQYNASSNTFFLNLKRTDGTTASTNYNSGSGVNRALNGDTIGYDIDFTAGTVRLMYKRYLGSEIAVGTALTLSNGTATIPAINTIRFSASAGGLLKWDSITAETPNALTIAADVQRDYAALGGFGYVPLSGNYNTATTATSPPTSLEWRLKYAVGGTVVPGYDWQAMTGAIISSGSWRRRVLMPEGGMYTVEVRDNFGTVVTSTTPVGVGDGVLGYGQSNMAGASNLYTSAMGGPAIDTSTGRAYTVNPDASGGTSDRTPPGPVAAAGFERAIAGFTNTLIGFTNKPCLIINKAVGGASLANLSPGAGTNYFTALRTAILDNGGVLTAMLIDQGEADSSVIGMGTSAQQDAWAAGWAAIVTEVLKITGLRASELPVFMAYTYGSTDTFTADGGPGPILIRKAQKKFAALSANYALSHHKFDMDYGTGENIHQSIAHRYTKHGPRFAYAIAKKRGLSTYNRMGPFITSGAKVSAGVVDLTVDLNGAATFNADPGTLKGFQVMAATGYTGTQTADSYFPVQFASPAPLAVTATLVSGKIRLSFADPGTPVAIRYAGATETFSATLYMDGACPFDETHGTTGQTAPPQFRGNYSDGSTVGLAPLPDGIVVV